MRSKLSGDTDFPNEAPYLVNFDLGDFDLGADTPLDTGSFNPLHQFDHIGKKKLDQVCHAFTLNL